jgi:PAS domain S-box-containing protein
VLRRLLIHRPPLWALLILASAVFLTAWGGIEFTRVTEGWVAAIWVSNAIVLAFLLRSPTARWPWYVATGCIANLAANLLSGDAPATGFLLAACNTAEILLAAAPLRRWWGPDADLSRPSTLLPLAALAVVAGPAVSAALASAGLATLAGVPFLEVWRVWFLANGLGMMVFAPLFLTLPLTNPFAGLERRTVVRAVSVLAACAAVTVLVFAHESYPFLFLALPPLVWAAFVLGCAGAAAAITLAAAIAIGMTVAGHGPLHPAVGISLSERTVLLQAFLASAVLVAVPVATALAERRRLAGALRESEARHRLLADNSSDLIVLKHTLDGPRRYVSAACRAILGYEPEELAAIPPAELVHPEDVDALRRLYGTLAPARPQVACTFRMRHRDGRWVWMEFVYKLTLDPDTEAPVVVGTGRDVTHRKRNEAAVAAALDRAKAAARAKSTTFLATMSHEIRTPLTAVIGMADLLGERALDAEAGRYVEAIRGAGRQLLSMVNDILDFQRLDAGRMRLHERDFDLASVIDSVASVLRPVAVEKGLSLELSVTPDVPPLRGDPVRLKQILFNLLGNAIKFTAGGVVELRCAVGERADGRIDLRAEVRDTGIGIERGQLASLFQPFTQLDDSSSRRFGGTGLGLAISKQIVELMGGRIGCRSRPGEGSTFWIEVPLARGETTDVAVADASASAPATPPLDILLAEDAPLNRQLLGDLLGHRGHRVTMSENGAEFLERAGARRFDVLLVDIQMPVLDGEEAIRSLRRREGPNRATSAVALTANVMEDDRRRYLEAGFDAVLHKPIAFADLLGELARLAGRKRSAAEAVGRPEKVAAGRPSTVDWSFVEATLAGLGEAAAEDFLGQALADARKGLADLRHPALGGGDRARLAHRLKGTARSFGLVGLGDAAEAIELAAKSGRDVSPGLDRYAAALELTAEQLADRPPAS